MQDTSNDIGGRTALDSRAGLMRILPMYIAAYAVLLCGLGAYVTTYEDDSFGAKSLLVVLMGLGVSLFCRWRQMRQNTMFGIVAGLVVVSIFWISVSGGTPPGEYLMAMTDGRNSGLGMVLAWFLVLYAFAMIADEVIIFSVVPSIALLGLMASDNLNPEIVIYFLGLVVSAVFLLVYENMLSRGVLDRPQVVASSRPGPEPENSTTVEPAVRTSLLLTSIVAALALVVGFAASLPLSYIGQAINDRTPQINLPAAAEFAAAVSNRYINQIDLDGAPPRLSERVVMEIRSPRPFYWRSKVFNRYTGYSWTAEGSPVRMRAPGAEMSRGFLMEDQLYDLPFPLDVQESSARQKVLHYVRTFDPPVAGMLVSAAEPQRVWIRRRGIFVDPERGIGVRSGRSGTEYKVLSQVSIASPDQLRKADTRYPVALRSKFTQLEENPEDAPASRHDLAVRLTEGYDNPYDKVKALETYLRENFLYSLTPPRTPRSEDAVMFFLTESKQGYCEIFASSMAVLAREIGIPARLATGFAPGEWKADGRHGWGTSTLREKDLHAWTEVFFPGYGWISFDPTSSREVQNSWATSFQDFLRSLVSQVSRHRAGPSLILLSMFGILLFLAKTYVLDPVRASVWWRTLWVNHRRDLSADERWDLLYARSHRRMKRWAGTKPKHQTPYEYAESVRPKVVCEAASVFDEMTALYVNRSFRRGGPDSGDVQAMLRLDAALKRALRHRPAPGAPPAASSPASA